MIGMVSRAQAPPAPATCLEPTRNGPVTRPRATDVFHFNPFTESFLAEGRAFTPTRRQARLAADLAGLPLFLASQGDVVLVPRRPRDEFLVSLTRAGFGLPEFVEIGDACLAGGGVSALAALASRELGRLRPWAWGPDSVALLGPLFASVTGEDRTPHQRFNPGLAELYSKAWSAAFLRRFLTRTQAGQGTWGAQPWLCGPQEVGVTVSTLPEALEAVATIRARGHQRVVAKQAFGSAGQNTLRLWESSLLETQRRWLERLFDPGREVVIEPWLERAVDFSLQLEMTPQGLRVLGFTGLANDTRGQFVANWAESERPQTPPASVLAWLAAGTGRAPRLDDLFADLCAALAGELQARDFQGPLGMDAFVYRDTDGRHRLKPVVEINPRYTMGRLTLELMRHVCPGSLGRFRLCPVKEAQAAGFVDLASYGRALAEGHPVRLSATQAGRIEQGVVCLNDPAQAQVCLALLEVRPAREGPFGE